EPADVHAGLDLVGTDFQLLQLHGRMGSVNGRGMADRGLAGMSTFDSMSTRAGATPGRWPTADRLARHGRVMKRAVMPARATEGRRGCARRPWPGKAGGRPPTAARTGRARPCGRCRC